MDSSIPPIPFTEIQQAKDYMKGKLQETPLVPLWGSSNIFLKLENVQPIGSFKLRGAMNAVRKIPPDTLKHGVFTASAGNFAQGLAWYAKQAQVTCNVVVPNHAPHTKVSAVEKFGGIVTRVDFDRWWTVLETRKFNGMEGTFVHPVCEPDVIAGNSTIGIEIVESLPHVDNIIVPYGGGGLLCGIASAAKALNPNIKVYACEVETASPLKASLMAGEPVTFPYKASFVDGMGGKSVLPQMWSLVKSLVTDSIVVTLKEVVDAVSVLSERNHVRAEGAGAATVAAAMKGVVGDGTTVCVISGGNIDTDKYIQCLQGKIPA